ncbi:MAG TPA: ATP-binding protein [Stellaceae bacterium]|nr:ATP-binding protein [Stellaceae bacterium]
MRSSPIDPPPAPPSEAAEDFDIRQRGWIKRLLPQTMFGRSLLLIVMPLVLVQIIATWVFYARHWETVSRRLSSAVAGDVALIIGIIGDAEPGPALDMMLRRDAAMTDLAFSLRPGSRLPPLPPPGGSMLETQLRSALKERLAQPFDIDAESDRRDVRLAVLLPQGVLSVVVPRERLYTSTTYIFILWMIGSSLILMGVAAIFLRNQVRSLRRLAAAVDGFGKGRPVPFPKIEGALEVRRAGLAFIHMRDRIQRQIRQRTEMLAGVSHDLRTPLTRMKLALEMLGENGAVGGLKSDVAEMQRLVDLYLDFARGEGTETPVDTDIAALLDEVAATARREGTPLSLEAPPGLWVPVRPHAIRRCLGNLVSNARSYGTRVWLTGRAAADGVDILVDDDGPGIPPEERDRVFQPFVRLDASRNKETGGIGLGLTIARDVARSHGGDVRLETSPQGGLRARIHLPG